MSEPLRDPVTIEADRALRALAGLGGDLVGHANRLAPIIFSPPRVVIVGRLKAGKSTLVNALVGEKIAATGALEVTRVLSVFHYGAPARAELHVTDGRVMPVPLVEGMLQELPVPADQVTRVDRFLPSRAIQEMTLIDTPGLATLTAENEERARKALLPGYDQTAQASIGADAAVFVFESLPRAYERDFVQQLGFTPLNTIGVLARADSFGEGAMGRLDPVDAAADYSRTLAGRMEDLVANVVPSCGLLAEAAATGVVTEELASRLARYGSLSRRELFLELESDEPRILPAPQRDALIDAIGEYGVIEGARIATGGAAALNRWLEDRSGVVELDRKVRQDLLPFASLQRALRLHQELTQLAVNHPAGDRIRHIAQVMLKQPAMVKVALFRGYCRVIESSPRSRLVPIVRRALQANGPTELLGIAPECSQDEIRSAAQGLLGQLQQMEFVGTSAAEDLARGALARYMYARGLGA